MSRAEIVQLGCADLAQLESLLRANQLPADDCADQAHRFCAIYRGDQLIAAGAIEVAGQFGLLRSVVVREDCRGMGLARNITAHLLQQAREEGRLAIYLLTETAEAYFAALGFSLIPRSDAPPALTRTRQFSLLCPDSASCMCLQLRCD